jgi:hypothetical protein
MDPISASGIVLGVLAIALVAGLLAGQFRRGVVQELRASLDTAAGEIAIERGRADRLEGVITKMQAEITILQNRIALLQDFNKMAATVAAELSLVTKQTALDLAKITQQTATDLAAALDRQAGKVAAVAVQAADDLAAKTVQTATDLEAARKARE